MTQPRARQRLGDFVRLFQRAFALLAVCLTSAAAAHQVRGDEQAGQSLVVASSNNFPPVNILDEGGQLTGFGRDLSDAVVRAAGCSIERIHSQTWAQVLSWLADGRADFIHDAGYTLERDEYLDFTDSILEMPEMIFVSEDRFDILSLEDLAGKKVACVREHITHLYLKQFTEIELVIVETPLDGLLSLIQEEVDSFIYPKQIVLHYAQKLRVRPYVKAVGEPVRVLTWHMAAREGDAATVELLNKGLATVRASGEYDQIYNKWFGEPLLSGMTVREVRIVVVTTIIVSAFGVGIVLSMIFVWRLRKARDRLQETIEKRERAEAALKDREEQLIHSQRMEATGLLAGGVAHDFNNLLFAMKAAVGQAEHIIGATHAASAPLSNAQDAMHRAQGLTSSLLTFTRRASSEKKAVEVDEVIAETANFVRDTFPASIRLRVVPSKHQDAWVVADDTQLQQVLLNLAINARDAMHDKGTLTISATREPCGKDGQSQVVIQVKDTGIGMTPEIKERVFEPYFTTKARGQGTGLGLSIIHGIVSEHGGSIELDSDPGRGTTFSVRLPGVDPPREAPDATELPKKEVIRRSGGVVLLAEDNDLARGAAASMLSMLGYEVVEASDGALALDRYEEEKSRIDLLILDVDMPHRSGVALLEGLRERGCALPAVLISGAPIESLPPQLIESTCILHKPFSIQDLRQEIAGLHI